MSIKPNKNQIKSKNILKSQKNKRYLTKFENK